MVELEQVSVRAGGRVILDDVSLAFRPNRFNVILGPNGAGKSTLLKVATGLLKPTTGMVRYAGREIHTMDPAVLARTRAVLSQHVDLAFPLPAQEVVMMGRYPHFRGAPLQRDREIVANALELVGMTARSEQLYPTLSGGEQQKVQLARVLAQIWHDTVDGPDTCLFLDEPTSNLDIRYQLQLLDLARTLRDRRCTVVAIVHDLNVAASYGDAFFLLDHGRLVHQGDAAAALSVELIEAVFQVRARRVPGSGNEEAYWRFSTSG